MYSKCIKRISRSYFIMKTLAEEFKALAARHNITVFVDQLYSRMMYSGEVCTLSRVKKHWTYPIF